MKRTLENIDRNEILYYLNYPKNIEDSIVSSYIDEGIQQILEVAKPRILYKIYTFSNHQLKDCSLTLEGEDIQRLLETSSHVILICATLGSQVDQLLKKTQIQDMGKAFILDQCANAGIEQVIEDWEKEARNLAMEKGWFLSDRYSPGYGDLPIHLQKDFISELDAKRKVGLHVSESNVLLPCKSITAIIGVSQRIQPSLIKGCEVCALRLTCQKRKDGNPCVKK